MTRRRVLVAGVAALALVAVALVAVLATRGGGEAPGWGSPRVLSGEGGYVAAAVTGDGTTIAVWTRRTPEGIAVMSADRPAGGGWGAPRQIAAPRRWGVLFPDLAVNARGDAVVAFSYWSRQMAVLVAVHRPAGGDWEGPQAIGPVERGFYATGAAVGAEGGALVAWSTPFGARRGLRAAEWTGGVGWSDPVRIATPGGFEMNPRVAIAPDGTAFAALPQGDVHRRAPSGGWARLPALPGEGDVGDVALAVDADGRLTAAWTRLGPGARATLSSSRLEESSWASTRVLDRAGGLRWFTPLVAAPSDGGVAVAWARWEREWTRVSVRAATAAPGGRLGPARELDAFAVPDLRGRFSAATPGPPPTRLVMGAGRPMLLWDRLMTREPTFLSRLLAARPAADGTWSRPEPVTGEAYSGWPLSVGRTTTGAVAVWARFPARAGGPVEIVAADRRD